MNKLERLVAECTDNARESLPKWRLMYAEFRRLANAGFYGYNVPKLDTSVCRMYELAKWQMRCGSRRFAITILNQIVRQVVRANDWGLPINAQTRRIAHQAALLLDTRTALRAVLYVRSSLRKGLVYRLAELTPDSMERCAILSYPSYKGAKHATLRNA